MKAKIPETINIRPGVSILSVLRHLNYKPWFALAEFVDNSLQSFLDHRKELDRTEGKKVRLIVNIEFDPTDAGQLTIRDNAAGIHQSDYARAFRPAELPPDTEGLSEFGMGMKSAACWFAPQWTVRTSALGEKLERTVSFNIEKIVQDKIEELTVDARLAPEKTHFTEIKLYNLHKAPQGRTLSKIKEHLASIYRSFIREGLLELKFDEEVLAYVEPKVLFAPYYKDPPLAQAKDWRKEVAFDFGLGMRAHGFAALRETGSTSGAGFSLFRRGRLIQGSADEGYRPEYVFGKSNSFTYQRLFGELQLEGFEVSHTKDGFRWDEHEEVFLEFLRESLNEKRLPLLSQAEGYRARPKLDELRHGATVAAGRTAEVIEREVPPVIEEQLTSIPDAGEPPKALPLAEMATTREIELELDGSQWLIVLELTDDPGVGDWVSISDRPLTDKTGIRRLGVRLSLAHPFMLRFGGVEPGRIEPLLRVAVAICLAEITARDSGVKSASTIRRNINQLLGTALSQP
ncbi:MAG: ATP-binding protein [Pyrinomonadaceae bacterium]|nr:ATP-binding protein [Pyrinomonadaceae bacterium]